MNANPKDNMEAAEGLQAYTDPSQGNVRTKSPSLGLHSPLLSSGPVSDMQSSHFSSCRRVLPRSRSNASDLQQCWWGGDYAGLEFFLAKSTNAGGRQLLSKSEPVRSEIRSGGS